MIDDRDKVIEIRPRKIVYCPRCGWGGLMPVQEIYWCDKCTGRFKIEEE